MRAEPEPGVIVRRHDTRLPAGRLVKRAVDACFIILALPLAGWFHLWAKAFPGRADVTLQGLSQLVGMAPGIPGVFLRRAFYTMALRRCDAESSIGFGTIIATPNVEIGRGVYIGPYCNIGHASIGDDTLLGSNVTLLGGTRQHGIERLDIPIRLQPGSYRHIQIGRDVWIGNGAIVAEDVGDQAVVGAGSVVTKPVPSLTIVAGNPARAIAVRGEGTS